MSYLIWQHADGRIEETKRVGESAQTVFNATPAASMAYMSWPEYVKEIARMRKDEDTGAGDTATREIGEFESVEFKQWFDIKTGFKASPCKCKKEVWNRKYNYSIL